MKRIFTLAVMTLVLLGVVMAQETDRELERCGDAVCEVAEAQGLYTQLDKINSNIEEVQSVLARCETDYCRSVLENADKRVGLLAEAEKSSNSGDMDATIESLREIQAIVHRDIAASEKELEGGETNQRTVETVLDLEERISSNVSSALESSSVAAVVGKAVRCPDGKCGAEVNEAARNAVKFKAGAELSKTANGPPDWLDLDSDGDGIGDVEDLERGEFPKEWTLPTMDLRAEMSKNGGKVYRFDNMEVRAALENDGEVYCWGSNRCVIREDVERSDAELVEGIASESGLSTAIDASENQSEKAQESISKRSARTGRNPETGRPEAEESGNDVGFEGELKESTMANRQTSEDVSPVNDPPSARPRERVRAAITQRIEKISLAVENMYQE